MGSSKILSLNNERLKKQITYSSYLLIAICLIFALATPIAKAKQNNSLAMQYALRAVSLPTDAFSKCFADDNKMYEYCVGSYNAASGTVVMPKLMTESQPGQGSLFGTAYSAFKVIGLFLAISVALGRLFQKMEKGQDGSQVILLSIMSICITGLVIMNIEKISGVIGEMGRYIIKMFVANEMSADEQEAMAKALLEAYTGSSTGSSMWNFDAVLALAIPSLANTIAFYTIYITIFSKFIEIALLRMFMPLAIYDIYDEGLRSSGAQYLKSYLSVFISLAMGAFVVNIAAVIPGLMKSPTTGYGTSVLLMSTGHYGAGLANTLKQLYESIKDYAAGSNNTYAIFIPTIINFITVKLMKKTDQFARQVVGLR